MAEDRPTAEYGHVLHVVINVPHVVDDYGTEIYEAEVSYYLECLGVTEECAGLIECDCTHPEDDEQFGDPDEVYGDTDPRFQAFSDAMAAYEEAHPEPGWEPSGTCWAKEALADWEPDRCWEPGAHPVKVAADRSWGGPEDAALMLIPVTASNGSQEARTVIWDEVAEERRRAHAKHGDTSMEAMAPTAWRRYMILAEEVGEVAKEFNDADHEKRVVDTAKVRKELIQVAAMAGAWADALGHTHPEGHPCGRCCWPEDCAVYCIKADRTPNGSPDHGGES